MANKDIILDVNVIVDLWIMWQKKYSSEEGLQRIKLNRLLPR